MKVKHRFWFLVGFLCCLSPLSSAAQNDQKLAWIEGRCFEIIGTDMRSVSFTNTLGEHIVEIFNRYLRAGSHDFPQRIVVVLQPEENVKFKGDYRIKTGSRGQVSLELRWGTALKFETLCRALTEAYLVRYATFNYGPGAAHQIRFWAVSALASWSYLSLRPAQKTTYIRDAREHGVSEIALLLTLDLESRRGDKHLLRQGYWVFHTLRQYGLEYSTISDMLDPAVMGADITAKIEALAELTSGEAGSKLTLENWWQNQMIANLSQEYEYCDSLETSRTWIEDLANFDNYRDSDSKLENLMDLWKYRSDEALRSILTARCEIIRLRIERVNPAYFNAALSLGVLYETTMESEHKHEFIHALAVYLSDWADTKQLHTRALQMLSEAQIQDSELKKHTQ